MKLVGVWTSFTCVTAIMTAVIGKTRKTAVSHSFTTTKDMTKTLNDILRSSYFFYDKIRVKQFCQVGKTAT